MNKDALFCDGTSSYVIPAEPDEYEKVKLKFRTAKDDADEVCILTKTGGFKMKKTDSRGEFDYYEIDWQLGNEPFSYSFEVKKDGETCYFNRCGVAKEIMDFYAFVIVPGFSTPDWAKGAVMYQIFVDRFFNGDESNDVEDWEYIYIGEPCQKVTDWDQLPQAMDIRRFYGGRESWISWIT